MTRSNRKTQKAASDRKLRILIGPGTVDRVGNEAFLIKALRKKADVLTFGPTLADVRYDPEGQDFGDVCARLGDWRPDVIVVRDAEYYPLPYGIDTAEVPIVALIGDWNVCYSTYSPLWRSFDLLLTDVPGVEVARKDGFEAVEHFPMYGYDPEVHVPSSGKRRYQVGTVVNLNHVLHRRRARLLYRLAGLPEEYDVRIEANLFGRAYTRLLQDCELVFNCSVRGEMNMRAFEAPACGAVLLQERDNRELRQRFDPEKHLLTYDESDFEDVVLGALRDGEALERIRAQAREALRGHSYDKRAEELLETLRGLTKGRRARTGDDVERLRWWVGYYVGVGSVPALRRARALSRALTERSGQDFWRLASVCALLVPRLPGGQREAALEEAFEAAERAKAERQHAALLRYNLGMALFAAGAAEHAESHLKAALRELGSGQAEIADPLVFTGGYTPFRVEWEKAWAQGAGDPEARRRGLISVLKWQIEDVLGQIALRRSAEEAVPHLLAAVGALPAAAETRHRLAVAQWGVGQAWAAYENLKQCLAQHPFYFPAWLDMARVLAGLGQGDELRDFMRERLAVLRRIPPYFEVAQRLASLWFELQPQVAEQEWASRCGGVAASA